MSARARLAPLDLPEFGMPEEAPQVPPAVYRRRLDGLRERAAARGWDRLVVYADREHSANLAYLTGFDPRFEEALLVLGPEGDPALLVGNECFGLAGAGPVPLRPRRFADFSLPGQPGRGAQPIEEVLAGEGIGTGSRVGVAGWKEYRSAAALDVPAYLADALRGLVGPGGVVENATGLLISAADGMRVTNEVEQLACFEYAACLTSQGVRRLLFGLRPGMREDEAVRLLEWNGMPLSCHLMLSAGERAALGLVSPGRRVIQRGDPFTVAFGVWGALNCRAGFAVADAAELPAGIADYVERLVAPYFAAVAEWYGELRVGVAGGVLHEVIARRLGDPFFGVGLNPGHQIHLDEWVNSPVFPGSTIELPSGTALQVDVIPATGTEYFTTNIEDGVALADAALRRALAEQYPGAWGRITARRRFMEEALGIPLHPDVLPFSNIPAYLPPFLLAPHLAMTLA